MEWRRFVTYLWDDPRTLYVAKRYFLYFFCYFLFIFYICLYYESKLTAAIGVRVDMLSYIIVRI